MSLLCIQAYSQRIIDHPCFAATTSPNVQITKIELSDTAAVLYFEVSYFPKLSIRVSSDKTYIQDSKGGDQLYVKRADGIELNKWIEINETGKHSYKLFFPPLNKETALFNFEEETWRIFDIEIVPQEQVSVIPEQIKGNWLRTDGSNDWVLGVYDSFIIYENELWDKVLVSNKKNTYSLHLQRNGKSKDLLIKSGKNKNILVGPDLKSLSLLSKDKMFKKDFVIANDSNFELPVFSKDTFVYQGYIKGYHPKMGKTGILYVNDILNQEQNSNLITINPDGTFLVRCFMLHPQTVFLRMPGITEAIFAEPGKKMVHYVDISEYNTPFKTHADFKKRERKSLFMGDNARVNADLQSIDSISYYDYEDIKKRILDMDGNQYKDYCIGIIEKEQAALQEYAANHAICRKALTLKYFEIPYRTYERILWFNNDREEAYRRKNKIPDDQREIPLKRELFQPDYYDFINVSDLNNPISLVSGSAYKSLINRIQYADCVREYPRFNDVYIALLDSLTTRAVHLTPEEIELLGKLKTSESMDDFRKEIGKQDVAVWSRLAAQNSKLIDSISRNRIQFYKDKNYEKYFGLTDGLAKEIMFSQTMCSRLRGRFKPFSEEDKQQIKQAIKSEFIIGYLMQLSKATEEEISKKTEFNKKQAGYHVNEIPKTERDKLFDAIIQKYKGRVVFVDFWATWCGPCRSGIEKLKPLKEELKDKNIVFVYITDESSPIDTWNLMIPDIKGEHYRLKKDEWNYLASKFKISGIPHYILVDKEGKVVRDKIHFLFGDTEFKQMINECLE